MTGIFGWEFPNDPAPPPQENACRCLESALSITLSIRKGNTFTYSGAMDLALNIEAQLRETIPIAVQCTACKVQQGETLKLLSNAMADAVDLLQQLCNVEFSDYNDLPPSSKQQGTFSMLDRLEWLQPSQPNGQFMPSSRQSMSHERNGSNGSSVDGTQKKLPSPPKSVVGEQNQPVMSATGGPERGNWRILFGRHQLVGDDREFVLMHLLRRRLFALSNVLEDLIRAMQDLRMANRRELSFVPFESDVSNAASEIDMRKSMKTASKLYDIIDHLEGIRI